MTTSVVVSGIPCPVPYVANGTVSPSVNVVDGQTLRVDCKPGFTLSGSSIFNCGQSSPPTCVSEYQCAMCSVSVSAAFLLHVFCVSECCLQCHVFCQWQCHPGPCSLCLSVLALEFNYVSQILVHVYSCIFSD